MESLPVRQREEAFGESFRVQRFLVAPEPVEGNVGPCARVMSIRVRRFSANSGGTAILRPEHQLRALLILCGTLNIVIFIKDME